MSQFTKRCPKCKGKGQITHTGQGYITRHLVACKHCEGTGVALFTDVEEEASDYLESSGDKIYPDDPNFIDLEEDDYEV